MSQNDRTPAISYGPPYNHLSNNAKIKNTIKGAFELEKFAKCPNKQIYSSKGKKKAKFNT